VSLEGKIRVDSWNELIKIGTTSALEVEAKSLAFTLTNIRHVILKPTPGLGRLRVVGLASQVLVARRSKLNVYDIYYLF
jgi:hypothetical protein